MYYVWLCMDVLAGSVRIPRKPFFYKKSKESRKNETVMYRIAGWNIKSTIITTDIIGKVLIWHVW